MARARNIKPSFFQNEELGELSPLARLAFIGMWTIADYKGCFELKLKRLKVQLLPYDECSIEEITNNLERSGFISIYSVQGQRYAKIINFEKHQNPHKNERESGSEIPDISESSENKIIISELENIESGLEQDGTNRADSLLLIPSSLIPESGDSVKTPESSPSKKITLKTWLAEIKLKGEKPISTYEPVFEYCKTVGLDQDWLQIAWIKFVERFTEDEKGKRKLYSDWRGVFLRAVRENWFSLWYMAKDGSGFCLTTVGVQADLETREAA